MTKALPYRDQFVPRTAQTQPGYRHHGLGLERAHSSYRPPWWDWRAFEIDKQIDHEPLIRVVPDGY
jgi:hypothetical protein